MKIKFLCAAAAVVTAFASTAAFAEDAPAPEVTITGTAAVVSQYRFRGISQSDNKPAVQASITVAHKSGFYVSFWGSSASAGNSAVDIGGTEIDIYGGYTAPISTTGVTFDGGLYGYIYPGSNKPFNANHSLSYYEVYGSLTKAVGPVSLKVGVNYAPKQDYFKDFNTFTKSSFYKYVEASASIPNTAASVHAHLGHTAGGFDWAGKQVLDYSVGASYKVKSITLDASLVGANTSKADAAAAGWSELYRAAKPVGVLSLTASF
jgi:uncharacterized protein (TIGR02001 family)